MKQGAEPLLKRKNVRRNRGQRVADVESRTVMIENSDWWILGNGIAIVLRSVMFGGATFLLVASLGQGLGDVLFFLACWLLVAAITFGVGLGALVQVGDDGLVVERVGGQSVELPAALIASVWVPSRGFEGWSRTVLVVCRRRCVGRWIWIASVSSVEAAGEALGDGRPYQVSLL